MPYVNVTFENINEGMLLGELNRAIARIAEEVIKNHYEFDDLKTAKGAVMKLEIIC